MWRRRRRSTRRQVPAVLLMLSLLAGAGWWTWENHLKARHPTGPAVRISTWNIRQFSEKSKSEVGTVAQIITSSNFDLVAIQEIKLTGEIIDKLLNALGPPWRSTSISPRTGSNFERFTFIYRGDRVREIGGARFIDPPHADVFDRIPYMASFRAGQFDFTLVSVHLRHGDVRQRRREAEALARFARELAWAHSEKDIIVLGDFNEESAKDLQPFDDARWQRLNREPSNLSSTRTYDNLLIDPAHTREWAGIAGATRFDEIYYYNNDRLASERVSDHRPVFADFVINLPDDD